MKNLTADEIPAEHSDADEEIGIHPFSNGDLKTFILAQLALTMGMTASGLASRFGEERKVPRENRDALKASFISVAKEMHKEKMLHATPCDDDLSLLLL